MTLQRKPLKAHYDVVIVGAGGAGAPLAARLSEDQHRSVLLLEAGPVPARLEEYPPELLDAGTVQGARPGHSNNWSFTGYLTPDRPYSIARGRILGGSTAISGTYFVRAAKKDFEHWASGGNHEWAWTKALPFYRKLENDLGFPNTSEHGHSGPMTVSRLPQTHPAAVAFARATKELGFPLEPDKNRDGPPGYGPMPSNSTNGLRIDTGSAYINPVRNRPNLTVQGNTYVRRVLFKGTRTIGVEVINAGSLETITAGEVVLSAGAVKTPHILLLSGLGAASQLRKFGVPVVNDMPGVGKDFSDHPNIVLEWKPKFPLVDYSTAQAMAGLLNFTASGSSCEGDLEIIPLIKPVSYMLTGRVSRNVSKQQSGELPPPPGGAYPSRKSHYYEGDLALLVSLQAAASRGQLFLTSLDPAASPQIDFNYLSTDSDRRRLREAVRVAARLLLSKAHSGMFQGFSGLDEHIIGSNNLLDAWIRAHLGTALHLCGTAKFGSADDPHTVVDQYGRVHGIEGLRIADTSILPTAPTRGPAATAVLIGERIADFMRSV